MPEPTIPPAVLSLEQDMVLLRQWNALQQRLTRVAAPLLFDNAPLCKRRAQPMIGITAKNRHAFGPRFALAAERGLGLGERLQVAVVLEGSAAATSGLQAGDYLLAIDGTPIPAGAEAEASAARLLRGEARSGKPVKLTIARGDQQQDIRVPWTRGCPFAVLPGNTDLLNSYTDGQRIVVTHGLLEFVRDDTELAYVIAKEMGHAIQLRMPRASMSRLIDRIGRPDGDAKALLAAAQPAPYTPVADATADKIAIYLLARAGYDIEGVLPFWRRLEASAQAQQPSAYNSLHPDWPYRASVIQRIVQNVQVKQQRKWALLP